MKLSSDTTPLCFDDILLVPKQSNIQTRSELSLDTRLGNPNNMQGVITLDCPVILAPMEYISSSKMIEAVISYGGLAFIQRHQKINDRMKQLEHLSLKVKKPENLGFALNVAEAKNKKLLDKALSYGIRVFLLDTAFGHTEASIEAVKALRSNLPSHVHIMSGNVSSFEAYAALMEAGSDSVRVGVGGGAACTTRVATGFGVPVLGSVMDIYDKVSMSELNGLVSDGGIKNNGDIVKALAAGASAVMMGRLFAGHEECDSLMFRGLASAEIQKDFSKEQLYIEGVSGKVRDKGSVYDTLAIMINNIKSGLSYAGASTVSELRTSATYVKVSSASLLESKDRL